MKKYLRNIIYWFYKKSPFSLFRKIYYTQESQTPITFGIWFAQKFIGFNKQAYWPVHFTSKVIGVKNIYAGIETCPGYMPGCYIQGIDEIYIGNYTQISSNVGIISANHNPYNNAKHEKKKPIIIGEYCWIGMNSVILPGVELGDFTVVGAGSIVTKSFKEGYCVIAGNPAVIIKRLNTEHCVHHKSKYEFNGYVSHEKFRDFGLQYGLKNIDSFLKHK